MAIDPNEFRRVLGHFAAGVAVVTTRGHDGQPHGLTATSFTSVSLAPPLVLVCIDRGAESLPHFETSGAFAVNFLAASQRAVSERFARSGGDKFAALAWRQATTGCPILEECLGFVDCTVVQRHDGGDHRIYLGRVEAADAAGEQPLLYFRGVYRGIGGAL